MFKKLFGKKSSISEESTEEVKKKGKIQRAHTVDGSSIASSDPAPAPSASAADSKPKPAPRAQPKAKDVTEKTAAARRRKKNKEKREFCIDTAKPLEYPTVPEQIIDYHKQKPFLSQNEEWLVVELNEYECLVDSEEIIKIIAKHSKFFELDPPELWEEFFEFVEDVPSYDEVINYDVWQEFRDKCYPC